MKNCGKKILSVALAAAMSCSMISAFANTVSIESIKVLNSADDTTATPLAKNDAVSLTPEQLLQVTVKLSPDSGATLSAGDITFLSYKPAADGAEQVLDNTTIQYVDQQTATIAEDKTNGTATITFRPRTGLSTGTFTAKAGGTDAATADMFSYTVAEADADMAMTLSGTTVEAGGSITVTLASGETKIAGATVKATKSDDSTVVNAVESEAKDGTYTLTLATAGTYSVSVDKVEGYKQVAAQTVTVTAKTTTGPSDTDKNNAQNGLDDAIGNISKGTSEINLPSTVTTTEKPEGYTISYTIENNDSNAEIKDGKLTLKEGKFGAKVQLKADLGNGVSNTKTVYLFATGTNEDSISFGNIDMIADSEGNDAFDDDTSFKAIDSNYDYTAAAAEILNLALGRGNIANVPKGAVDINLDGNVTLAEYRMFKLLIDSSETYYVPSNFAAARSSATKSGN